MIITSRSRMVAYANCARLGYLQYDWEGTGLQPAAASLPLANGIAIHEALARILIGENHDEVISKTLADYEKEVRSRGILNEDPDGLEFLISEQKCWIEGIIRAWMIVRYPALRAEYDFVAVEKELNWPVAPDIIDTVRCDLLARRKSDGALFYIEWKTTSIGGDEWIKQWEHNTQLLANTQAIEEMLGERVEGVIIEGIIKGKRSNDGARASRFFEMRIQQSRLCYGYHNETSGEYQGKYTSAKGWRKVAVWEEMSVKDWVEQILDYEDLANMFCPVPPIRPNERHLQRWRAQTIAAERERSAKLEFVRKGGSIDLAFPMNDEHCFRYWGSPCPFEPLCFREEIGNDPLDSGLYEIRVPHHPTPATEESSSPTAAGK